MSHCCCLHSCILALAQGLFYCSILRFCSTHPLLRARQMQMSSHCEDHVIGAKVDPWLKQLPCWPLANHLSCYMAPTGSYPPMNCCHKLTARELNRFFTFRYKYLNQTKIENIFKKWQHHFLISVSLPKEVCCSQCSVLLTHAHWNPPKDSKREKKQKELKQRNTANNYWGAGYNL